MGRVHLSLVLLTVTAGATSGAQLPSPSGAAGASGTAKSESIQALVEARDVTALDISPDGAWIVFQTAAGSVTGNETIEQTWVVPSAGGEPRPVPLAGRVINWIDHDSTMVVAPAHPSGTPLVAYNPWRSTVVNIPVDTLSNGVSAITTAPNRERALYCATQVDSVTLDVSNANTMHGVEADSTYYPWLLPPGEPPSKSVPLHPHPGERCWISVPGHHSNRVDVPVRLGVPNTTLAGKAVWLRDSRSLIILGYSGSYLGSGGFGTSLYGTVDSARPDRLAHPYVVDARTGIGKPISGLQAGTVTLPSVSPDGRVFVCLQYLRSADPPSVVVLRSRDAAILHRWDMPTLPSRSPLIRILGWTADSHTVLAVTEDQGTSLWKERVVAIDVARGAVRELFDRDNRDYGTMFVADGGSEAVAYGRRLGELPQIYSINLRAPHLAAKVLVPRRWLNPELAAGPEVGYDTVRWSSADKTYTLQGQVLLPPGGHGPSDRYPLLIYVRGGPGPTRMSDWQGYPLFPILAFAARGYVVFMPNLVYRLNDVSGSERLSPAFRDLMIGIDTVVRRYPVSSARIGIAGHSAGGILSAVAITQTNRFRAAAMSEGIASQPLWFWEVTATQDSAFIRWGSGLGFVGPRANPWDTVNRAVVDANTPVYAADRVATPNLLETGVYPNTDFGIGAVAWTEAMRRFGVPNEWWVYPRSGHAVEEPRLRLDSYERNLRWFDYWLCDSVYLDRDKARRYEQWTRQRAIMGDGRWVNNAPGAPASPQ
jgi:dipeptidyl aminopeptidase/acylaminoacyl peptidase